MFLGVPCNHLRNDTGFYVLIYTKRLVVHPAAGIRGRLLIVVILQAKN